MPKDLVQETRWNRVYRINQREVRWESKFLDESFNVEVRYVRDNWNTWSAENQLDFSLAFCAKPYLTEEDQFIAEYLMEVADSDICSNIAILLPKFKDKNRAFSLIISKIRLGVGDVSNYFQALTLLKDPAAIPTLEDSYRKLKDQVEQMKVTSEKVNREYAYCCKALLSLRGGDEYKSSLMALTESPNFNTSRLALRLLRENWSE